MISVFSFFSGSGFLDLGFEDSGYTIEFINETHQPFLKAYLFARENMGYSLPRYGFYQGSIHDLFQPSQAIRLKGMIYQARLRSDVVGFIGGPPCPDFSIGGKNRGREGDKGKLTESYIELIATHQPDFFLFENVKGLWRTKQHRIFYEEMKIKLIQAGYLLAERLVNAIEYGVPQDRERIILVGFQKSLVHSLGYPFDSHTNQLNGAFPWQTSRRHSKEHIFSLGWPQTAPYEPDSIRPKPDHIIDYLTVEYWFNQNVVNCHPNAQHHFKPRQALIRFQTIDEGDDSKKSFKRLHRWRYSPTAAYGNNEVHIHPYKPRRISASEALAIQSLPSDFSLPPDMSLTNMFKTIGNGVPYLLSRALAQAIREYLYGTEVNPSQSRVLHQSIAQEPRLQLPQS